MKKQLAFLVLITLTSALIDASAASRRAGALKPVAGGGNIINNTANIAKPDGGTPQTGAPQTAAAVVALGSPEDIAAACVKAANALGAANGNAESAAGLAAAAYIAG